MRLPQAHGWRELCQIAVLPTDIGVVRGYAKIVLTVI
jgi:hypothetical protein